MALASYDPAAAYSIQGSDREYLRHEDTPYLVRIYQPEGRGPFPLLLSVHGGAWNNSDRLTPDFTNRSLAESGIVVASVDFRLAPAGSYPAQVQDVHYAARWLHLHAQELDADPATLGIIGSSSGGHTALLCALRPHDSRYAALPLAGEPAAIEFRYVISCWGVIDPWFRYVFAQTTPDAGAGFGGAEAKVRQTLNYFVTESAIHEGNPQEILERGEAQALPPILMIQGTEDMNIPLTLPQRFAPAYRAAGGEARVEWFPGELHSFASKPGPASTRAIELMKGFVSAHIGQPALA